jgi:hypothetical protein
VVDDQVVGEVQDGDVLARLERAPPGVRVETHEDLDRLRHGRSFRLFFCRVFTVRLVGAVYKLHSDLSQIYNYKNSDLSI